MAPLVTNGAMLQCPFGAAPSSLVVLPQNLTMASNQPVATIMDNKPIVNVPPFGMCSSIANPTVAAATAAASGVLTPMPCIPNLPAPWAPGSPTVLIGGQPTLQAMSKCACAWGGIIEIRFPGQTTANVP